MNRLPNRVMTGRGQDVHVVHERGRWTVMPAGGHFAALEQPTLLADDIRSFFRPVRG